MSGDAPDPPDYSGIAEASEAAAEIQAAIALEQLDWAKQQWADQKQAVQGILDIMMPQMREQWANAQEDRARYEQLYQPIEEAYLEKAAGWDTPERRAAKAAQAQSEISQQFDAQRKNALQRLESYGIDPSQTRNSALDLGVRVEQAKAMAQGSQAARDQVEREGMGYAAELTNVGRGLPAQGLQYASSSQGASTQAQGASGAWQGASAAMGTPTQWYSGADQSLGTWGNALTGGYNAQMGAYQADQMNNPMNLLATAGGAALGTFLADGGLVVGPGGPKGDQIPANLSDNEYVIPQEVVLRKGTEFFDKLIEKTHKDIATREQSAQVSPTGVAIPPPTSMDAPGMAAGGEIKNRLNERLGISQAARTTGIPTRANTQAAYKKDFPTQYAMIDGYVSGRAPPYELWKQNVDQYNTQLKRVAPQQVSYDPTDKSDAMQWLAYRRATRQQQALNDEMGIPPSYVPLVRQPNSDVLAAQRTAEKGWSDSNARRLGQPPGSKYTTVNDWRAPVGVSNAPGGWEGDDADRGTVEYDWQGNRVVSGVASGPRAASTDSLKAPMPKKTFGVERHEDRMRSLRRRVRAWRSAKFPDSKPFTTPLNPDAKRSVGMEFSKPLGMTDEEYAATRGGPTLGELSEARYPGARDAAIAQRKADIARIKEVGMDKYIAEQQAKPAASRDAASAQLAAVYAAKPTASTPTQGHGMVAIPPSKFFLV